MQNKIIVSGKKTDASKGVLRNFALKPKQVLAGGILTGLMLTSQLAAMGPNPSNSFGSTGISDPCEKASDPLSPRILYVPVVQNYILNGYSIGNQTQIAEPTSELNSLFATPGAFNDATAAKEKYLGGQGPAFIRELNKKAIMHDNDVKNFLEKGITNYKIKLSAPQAFTILHLGNNSQLNEYSKWDAKLNSVSIIVMSAQVEQTDLYAIYKDTVTAYERVKTGTLHIPALDINGALKTPAGLFYLGAGGAFENNGISKFSVPAKFFLYATQSHLYDEMGGVDSSIYPRLESIKFVLDNYAKMQDASAFVSIGDFFTRIIAGIQYLNYGAKPSYSAGFSTNFGYLMNMDYDINLLGGWARNHLNPYLAVVYSTPAEIENMQLKDGILDTRLGIAYKLSSMFGFSADVSYFPLQKPDNMADFSAYLRLLLRF